MNNKKHDALCAVWNEVEEDSDEPEEKHVRVFAESQFNNVKSQRESEGNANSFHRGSRRGAQCSRRGDQGLRRGDQGSRRGAQGSRRSVQGSRGGVQGSRGGVQGPRGGVQGSRGGVQSRKSTQNVEGSFSQVQGSKSRNHSKNGIHNPEYQRKNVIQESQSENGDGIPPHERITKPMGFVRLRDLVVKDPNEILLTICDKTSGFTTILEQEYIKRDIMAHVLLALGAAVSSHLSKNVNVMVNTITSDKTFFRDHLPTYLATFQQKCKTENYHLHSLNSFCDFLLRFQCVFPSSASDKLLIILPLLEKTCKSVLSDKDTLHSTVLTKIQKIEESNQFYLKDYIPKEKKQTSAKERMQFQDPPEDYRSIPTLPTSVDIHESCSFLRPNLVEGQYNDTEHYLDVQYRLLREDYVSPLREGVAEYLRLLKLNKPIKSLRDVRVYTDVHIVKQDFVKGGLVHIAQFDERMFSHVKWEYSKRFLSGSLLCLTDDNFRTMLFASVAFRDPKELSNGKLLLRFEELTDEVLNLSPLRSFVVIETNAYFEAYRHNLNALHDLNEDKLPMKPYIVKVQKTVNQPQYLKEGDTYDMRPLFMPLNKDNVTHHADAKGDVVTSYVFPTNISSRVANIPILKDDCWPSSSELNLDPSQYAAIKAAVTKEFAVIQGPPGTGKTYVGLRIAQLLLHNINKWQPEGNPSPILVVCYTNHALDQFLEGLLLFTQKIVRVGGRGTNEALASFQLSNLKRLIEEKRQVPNYIFKNIKQKNFEVRNLKEEIDEIKKEVEKCYSSVLDELILVHHMHPTHRRSLLRMRNQLGHDSYIMHDWLNIRIGTTEKFIDPSEEIFPPEEFEDNSDAVADENIIDTFENPEDIEGEEEADIDYIEAQRDINSDEFAGVSFDIPLYQNELEILTADDDDGWKVQGGEKKRKKYIKKCLNNSEPMSEEEVNTVLDVWALPHFDRWRLYKFWLEEFIKTKTESVFGLQQQLKNEFQVLNEMRSEEDRYVCQQAHVVGMTTTGAAKYRDLLQHLDPKIVIVEEAAEILESHIVTSLSPGTQHVILIGDHQQLRPNPTVHFLAVKFDLNISLFERMIRNGMDCYKLGIQHRMRPEIAALLVPHIYSELKNHESVSKFEDIKGLSKNVFFLTHNFCENQETDSKSKVNHHEATFLIKLCKYIILQGYDPSQITVLTTYSGQLFAFKRLMGRGVLQGVKFTVVDNYQGEENDIILISFVRSNEEGQIGFLKISNRVCVALSRAKKGLFCIGNFELLSEKSDLWKGIVGALHQRQAIGPSLQLMCQNHPGVSNVVACEKDFDAVPEGGCTRNCDFRLPCGHVCSLVCHPYDMEHINIRCQKSCAKSCNYGHPCKRKCFEKCGSCTQLVDKKMQLCGHVIKVQCHKRDTSDICTKLCERVLSCGHSCSNTCSSPCVVQCKKMIPLRSPICGHKMHIECSDSKNEKCLISQCTAPCLTELSCGHMCKGNCRNCHQGRLHVACNQPCKRVLVCGHECKSPCSKSCPPCKRPCENRCIHSKCPKLCGEPCDKCSEKCEWACEHKKCLYACGEICSRVPCDKPCRKLLKCEHECIGLCGEPCPGVCRICQKEVVEEIFFGSEDEIGARFVCLEDCKHFFEVDGITTWMRLDNKERHEIQMKACPKCKTVIRKNLHFGNVVKSCLQEIEKVKSKTFGDKENNLALQKNLLKKISGKGNQIFHPIIRVLESSKCRSIQEITVMENVINIIDLLEKSTTYIPSQPSTLLPMLHASFTDPEVGNSFSKLHTYVKTTKKGIIAFLQDEYLTASDQQLQEVTWEVHRLKLADRLLRFLSERTSVKSNPHLTNLMECVVTYAPFRDTHAHDFKTEFQKFCQIVGGSVINVSELEKKDILKAMGLTRGHWYQCPNGHVYCITECGGATEEGKCNECGERIGGSGHRLLDTNRVATAMDGARHSAWSEDMNMENFHF